MKRRRVRWSPEARRNLEDIVDRIAEDSPSRSLRFARRLLRSVSRLGAFPESGRLVPELEGVDPAAREVIVGDYRVLYRVTAAAVEVTTVVHGRRIIRATGD